MWSLESRQPEDRTGDIATPASPANGPSPVDFWWWIYPRHNFHLSDSRLAYPVCLVRNWGKTSYTLIYKRRERDSVTLCGVIWMVAKNILHIKTCKLGQRNWRCFSSTLEYHGNLKAPPPMPNPQKIHKALLRGDHPLMKPYIVYFLGGGHP